MRVLIVSSPLGEGGGRSPSLPQRSQRAKVASFSVTLVHLWPGGHRK